MRVVRPSPPAGEGRRLRIALLSAPTAATRRALLASGAEVALVADAETPIFGERAQALRDARPDLALFAPHDRGDADRARPLAEALRFGCAAQRPAPRVVVASGDDGAVARATALAAPFAVEVLPDLRREEGRARFVARVRELRREDAALRDDALETLARAIGRARGSPVLVVDVSDASTSLVHAAGDAAPVALHVRPMGLGSAADRVVRGMGADRVRRWIPWSVDAPTLLERVFNRARWPEAAATDRETRALEVALAHEALAYALAEAARAGIASPLRSAATILLTGRLAGLGRERAAAVAADGLEIAGPASIALDDGALVALASGGDAEALERAIRAGLAPIGALVPVDAERRAAVRIATASGAVERRVERGGLVAVPAEGMAEVSGPGLRPVTVAAGGLGVILDARPRPLRLPARDAERVPALVRWYEALGAGA